MIFSRLHINNWRQFRELDITFHERLTVLTGANGAGKTTLLNLLSRHFGWQSLLVSTPRRNRTGTAYFSDCWTDDYLKPFEEWLHGDSTSDLEPPIPAAPLGPEQQIGFLKYSSGETATLAVPPMVGAAFQIRIVNQKPAKGLHIPSHRPMYSYQAVSNIPTTPVKRSQAFSTYMAIVQQRHQGQPNPSSPWCKFGFVSRKC
jgi:ABC-type cobalamin/Fe3+-siderophores transport system ATPase subunit